MNFKKFNGTIWETVQHKRYGSGTDSLTAFPAMVQASGEPLTDYLISGNTVQDGTPTSEAPVDVVGCGVWDETYQSYKLNPTVNGTEHPIYLGQAPTTRRIKKLVLTGNEDWRLWPIGQTAIERYYYKWGKATPSDYGLICTHFPFSMSDGNFEHIRLGGISRDELIFYISKTIVSTLNDLKSYLAAQYAAGTPVTVWYILAEPETAVVNEPLMKIENYADTITMTQSGVTIPTSDGDNTISFGTTVQPSGMNATFKGWHPVSSPKTYDGNDWS